METIIIKEYAAKLYQMDIKELANETCFKKYYEQLSYVRRSKIDSYRFLQDKKLSLGAGILLDRGFSDYGLREASVAIIYGENGKPYLQDYSDIYFNLSHSEQMVAAVFANVEVGCDIEKVQQADLDVARQCFCPGEYDYIAGQSGEKAYNEAFYRLWTLKESFVKAVGLGLSLPLNSFEVKIAPNDCIIVCQSVDNYNYDFKEYRFGDYCVALCFRKPL